MITAIIFIYIIFFLHSRRQGKPLIKQHKEKKTMTNQTVKKAMAEVMEKYGIENNSVEKQDVISINPDKWEMIYNAVIKTPAYVDNCPDSLDFFHDAYVNFYNKYSDTDKEYSELIRLFKGYIKMYNRKSLEKNAIRRKFIAYEGEIIGLSDNDNDNLSAIENISVNRENADISYISACNLIMKRINNPKLQDIFKLKYIKEKKNAEIADILKISIKTVEKRVSKLQILLGNIDISNNLEYLKAMDNREKTISARIDNEFIELLKDEMNMDISEIMALIDFESIDFKGNINEKTSIKQVLQAIAKKRQAENTEAWYFIGAKQGESKEKYPDILDNKDFWENKTSLYDRIKDGKRIPGKLGLLASNTVVYEKEDIDGNPEFLDKVWKVKGIFDKPDYIPKYRRSRLKNTHDNHKYKRKYRITAIGQRKVNGVENYDLSVPVTVNGFDRSVYYVCRNGAKLSDTERRITPLQIPVNRQTALYKRNQAMIKRISILFRDFHNGQFAYDPDADFNLWNALKRKQIDQDNKIGFMAMKAMI
jgi:RNA polymerase sigma factor (sigma-70 family)